MAARRILLRGGTVVTMDDALGDLDPGDVLIEGSEIAAVGHGLEAGDAEVVDVTGSIVLPGLVEAHSHMWQGALRGLAHEHGAASEYFAVVHPLAGRFSAEALHAATYSVAIELLSFGVTTVFDFCHALNSPGHADAAVQALRDAGIRAVFANSFRDRPEYEPRAFADLDARIADAARLRAALPEDGRVTMAVALNNIEEIGEEANRREIEAARELGVLASVHSNRPGQVELLDRRGLLGPDIQWVHGLTMTDDELARIAGAGGALIVTPETEAALNGRHPQTGRALALGVTVAIGSDIPSAVNGDVLLQARYALQADRFRRNQHANGGAPDPLTPRAVLRAVTVDGARAVGLGDRTGRLAPGLRADVLVLGTDPVGRAQGDPAAHVVLQSHPGQVDLVIVDGEVRVRDGALVGVDHAHARAALERARASVR
jgi:5-methylthioadenosine/S-adenosylhomocysteine deaminase